MALIHLAVGLKSHFMKQQLFQYILARRQASLVLGPSAHLLVEVLGVKSLERSEAWWDV